MPVSWSDMQNAFEFASTGQPSENEAYLCKQTAEFLWHTEFGDEIDAIPDDIGDEEKYIRIPHKKELDLGKPLVFAFAAEFLPADFDEVRLIFSKKGAYGRFKTLLLRRKALDQWYAFESKAADEALRDWCDLNGIELGD